MKHKTGGLFEQQNATEISYSLSSLGPSTTPAVLVYIAFDMSTSAQVSGSADGNLQRFHQVSPIFTMVCDNCALPAYFRYGYIDQSPALLRQTPTRRGSQSSHGSSEGAAVLGATCQHTRSAPSTGSEASAVAQHVKCSACAVAGRPCNGCIPCRRCWENQLQCTYERQTWSPAQHADHTTPQLALSSNVVHIKEEELDELTNEGLSVILNGHGLLPSPNTTPGRTIGSGVAGEHGPPAYPSQLVPLTPSRRDQQLRICYICSTRRTTAWRKDSEGRAVCNACGLRLKQWEKLRRDGASRAAVTDGGGVAVSHSSTEWLSASTE